MKAMMQSRYVGWMAVRPLTFGKETFEPGDRVPQKHLDGMRDPEALVRTGRLMAVAKDMNKVPRYLRKSVTNEKDAKAKILAPRFTGQAGPVVPTHLVDTEHDPTSKAYAKAQKAAEKGEGDGEALRYASEDLNPADVVAEGTPYPVPPVPSIKVAEPMNTTGDKDVAPTDPMESEETVEQPALNASTEAWARYAVDSGQVASLDEVADLPRTELIEKYGTTEDEE